MAAELAWFGSVCATADLLTDPQQASVHCERLRLTILPRSSPSPEPHQRKTKERSAEISSISSFMI